MVCQVIGAYAVGKLNATLQMIFYISGEVPLEFRRLLLVFFFVEVGVVGVAETAPCLHAGIHCSVIPFLVTLLLVPAGKLAVAAQAAVLYALLIHLAGFLYFSQGFVGITQDRIPFGIDVVILLEQLFDFFRHFRGLFRCEQYAGDAVACISHPGRLAAESDGFVPQAGGFFQVDPVFCRIGIGVHYGECVICIRNSCSHRFADVLLCQLCGVLLGHQHAVPAPEDELGAGVVRGLEELDVAIAQFEQLFPCLELAEEGRGVLDHEV